MYGSPTGSKLVTSDGSLIDLNTGEGVRIFNMHILASGTATPIVTLRNGVNVSGTIYIKETGTASTGKTFDYGINGKWFPSGCYVSQSPADGTVNIEFRKDIS